MKSLLLLLCLFAAPAFGQSKVQLLAAQPEVVRLVHHRAAYLADALLLNQRQARQVEKLLQLTQAVDGTGNAGKVAAQQRVVLHALGPRQYQALQCLAELPSIHSPASKNLVAIQPLRGRISPNQVSSH